MEGIPGEFNKMSVKQMDHPVRSQQLGSCRWLDYFENEAAFMLWWEKTQMDRDFLRPSDI